MTDRSRKSTRRAYKKTSLGLEDKEGTEREKKKREKIAADGGLFVWEREISPDGSAPRKRRSPGYFWYRNTTVYFVTVRTSYYYSGVQQSAMRIATRQGGDRTVTSGPRLGLIAWVDPVARLLFWAITGCQFSGLSLCLGPIIVLVSLPLSITYHTYNSAV